MDQRDRRSPLRYGSHRARFEDRRPGPKGPGNSVDVMSAINICFGVFVALISLFALRQLRRINAHQPQVAAYGSQRMCRACGSVTPRSEDCCLQCGKQLNLR